MNRLCRFLTLLLVFTVASTQITISPALGSLNRLVGVTTLVVWFPIVMTKREGRHLTPAHISALLFLGWAALSLLWTTSLEMTLARLLRYVQSIGMVFILWDVHRTEHALRDIMRAYVLGASVSVAVVFWAYFEGSSYASTPGRFAPPGFDPNEAAVIISLAVPMAYYLASQFRRTEAKKRMWLVIGWIYPFAATIAVILTGSRGGALAAVPAILYVVSSSLRPGGHNRLAFVAMGLAALLLASGLDLSIGMERILGIPGAAQADRFAGRLDIWQWAWEVFRRHPIIGVGAGALQAQTGLTYMWARVAHNLHLEVMADLGLLGYALFLGVVWSAVRGAVKKARCGVGAYAAILAVWFIGSLSLSWDYVPHTWLVLAIGVMAGAATDSAPEAEYVGASGDRASRSHPNISRQGLPGRARLELDTSPGRTSVYPKGSEPQ